MVCKQQQQQQQQQQGQQLQQQKQQQQGLQLQQQQGQQLQKQKQQEEEELPIVGALRAVLPAAASVEWLHRYCVFLAGAHGLVGKLLLGAGVDDDAHPPRQVGTVCTT